MKLDKKAFRSHLSELKKGFDIFYYADVGNTNIHPHTHSFYEMYLLITGEIAYHTSDGIFKLNSGDVLFIDEQENHCPILTKPNVPYERIVLDVSTETLRKLSNENIDLTECFHNHSHRVYRFPHEVQNSIRLILGHMMSLKQSKPFGYELLSDAYLTELFVTINQYTHHSETITPTDELKPNQLIAIVEQFITEQLDNEINVEDLAQFVCLSKYHFMRIFKKLTGKTVYQYIISKRLEAAKSLIEAGTDFTSAGQLCGFNDYSCFYRAFKDKYHESPKQYFNRV